MTNNQVAVKTTGDFLTNPQLLNAKIVKQYLDPSGKASDEELAYFIATCKERNLNPFTKEVYFIKYGTNPAQVVVSKDAFMKRAEEERKAKIERMAKEQAEASIKAYDAETGEVIEDEPKPDPANSKYVTTIKFWFDLEQAKQFKEWLDTHDIKFETVEGMKKC